ncbi:MAG: hypothetical protein GF331_04495, partial [Chitinivibrionales bacterium]|nr:hypothetical protein [Chitinivibrionales bacterium]
MNRTNKNTVEAVAGQAVITPTYLTLMASSGAVGAVGLLTNSVPLLVGSMVIAPVLPPLSLVAFAVTGWRPRLALRGLLAGVAGLAVSAATAMLITWVLNASGVI